jgi:two-component system, OmpR family, copper resistance phosphate regulon response regulator CusR
MQLKQAQNESFLRRNSNERILAARSSFLLKGNSIIERERTMITENGKIHALVFEEDSNTAGLIEKTLVKCGYAVDIADDSRSAIARGSSERYQIVIGDVCNPDKSGFEVLRVLHSRQKPIPFLALSEHHKEADRVRALEQGANDFLTKPFDEAELCARVQTVLWRMGISTNSVLQARDLTMDLNRRVVRRSSRTVDLTRTEFSLLELLLRNKNVILPRNYIREKVWGAKFEEGTNIVDVYINYLRSSIDKEFSPRLIHTVRGKGFMLRED